MVVLPLAELEPLSRLRTARLLPLHRPRVARQQSEIAELATVHFVDLHQRPRHGEAQRTGLARHAAAVNVGAYVETAERVGCHERLLDRADQRRTREIVAQRPAVHVPLPGARLHEYAAHGFFTTADRVDGLHVGHGYFSMFAKVNGV